MSSITVTVFSLFFFIYAIVGFIRKQVNIQYKIIYKMDTPLTFWTAIVTMIIFGIAVPCITNQVAYSFFFFPLIGILWVSSIVFYLMKL